LGDPPEIKGTVRPDLHESGTIGKALRRRSTAMGFLIFILILNIWYEFKVLSRFMQKRIQPPACLDPGLHGLKQRFFPPNYAPKMRERPQLFFGLWPMSKEFQHPALLTKIEQHFGWFFHQIKVRQPIGRQDSMQTVIHLALCLSLLMEAGTGRGCDGMGEFMCMFICVTTWTSHPLK
jgi:hypothetical protein